MTNREKRLQEIAAKYYLEIIYAFGSRAREAFDFADGKIDRLAPTSSDLDIAIKAGKHLTVQEKVQISLELEDLFDVSRVDLIVLDEIPTFLALEAVTGDLLYARDDTEEANYQLYVMRKAAELLPYERARIKQALEP